MEFYKISILVVTYNQHDVIGRALDSILSQKEYGLSEIVVCDDCSPDDNWEVISAYADKYPSLVRAFRNERNAGIYGNFERVVSLRGKADLFYIMAGDDELCEGWFREAQQFLAARKTDIRNEAATLYSDWKSVSPDGKEVIFRNDMIAKGYNAVSLKTRGLIYNRSLFMTGKVLARFTPVDLSQGVCVAESQFDYQTQLYSAANYYCPFVGSIYYSGLGVSTRMHTAKYYKERILALEDALSRYAHSGSDKHYINYLIHKNRFYIEPSVKEYIRSLGSLIRSISFTYGVDIRKYGITFYVMAKKLRTRNKPQR